VTTPCLFATLYCCRALAADNDAGLCALHWEQLAPYAKTRLALPLPAHWPHGVSRWPAPLEPTRWNRTDVLDWERARIPRRRILTHTPDGWRTQYASARPQP